MAAADPHEAPRIVSIDLIRGAVMVLMALDHMRVYSGLPAGGPTPGLFFTRWVTHFCAPAFVFLAGTSAYLHGRRHADLSRFLAVRGAWLVLLELTVLRLAWTFNLDYAHYVLAGVIWVIGWSMLLLSLLVKLPLPVVGALGVAVIAGHNLLDARMGALLPALGDDARSALWKILYVGFFSGPVALGASGPPLYVLYSIVPWVGVMAAGYGFGGLITLEPARRDKLCVRIGLLATALFLVLRAINGYGDPRPWSLVSANGGPPRPILFAFLSTTKYPASLDFLLMTLGPTIALMPSLERARGRFADGLAVFGRVPLFFYLLHIPLVHLLAILVSLVRTRGVDAWLFTNHPMANPEPPPGYTWSLWLLYVMWVVAVLLLHPACRWFAQVKARRGQAWLRYL